MTDSAKPTEKIHGARESSAAAEIAASCYQGDDREWPEAKGWLLPSDSRTRFLWKQPGLPRHFWNQTFFFFHRINLSSTSWITKHIFCLDTGMTYNSLSLLLSRNSLQSTLDTIVKQAWFAVCVMFSSKVGIFFVFSLERVTTFLYPSSVTRVPSSLPHPHTKTLLNCITVRLTSNPN